MGGGGRELSAATVMGWGGGGRELSAATTVMGWGGRKLLLLQSWGGVVGYCLLLQSWGGWWW